MEAGVLLCHPTGSQFSRNALQALADAGLLAEFWTCVSIRPESLALRLLPGELRRELLKRSFPPELRPRTHSRPWKEIARQALPRLGLKGLAAHEVGRFSTDAVYRDMDLAVARRLRSGRFSAAYCYEDGALASLEAARETGAKALYELPIGHWRAMRDILGEEAEREPEWASTLEGLKDSAAKLERKDRELAAADVVFVPSPFVRDSLHAFPHEIRSIQVVRYGAPTVSSHEILPSSNDRLKALFVGQLGARKGLQYLVRAVAGLPVDLTLVGSKPFACAALDAAIRPHIWLPPMPHGEVLAEMRRADVFVFPSLFEGQAQVMLEAMSQGLPVIATPNAGAEGLIQDGVDGYLTPIREIEPIRAALMELRAEPERLRAMKVAAREKAGLLGWDRYRDALAGALAGILELAGPGSDP